MFKFKFKISKNKYLVYKTKEDNNKVYYLYKKIRLYTYKKIDKKSDKNFIQLSR